MKNPRVPYARAVEIIRLYVFGSDRLVVHRTHLRIVDVLVRFVVNRSHYKRMDVLSSFPQTNARVHGAQQDAEL